VTTFVLRDGQGRCIEVADGKPGLLLIQVTDSAIFEGYTDAEASAKKLVKDAAISGDTYFNSGDLTKTIDVVFSFGKEQQWQQWGQVQFQCNNGVRFNFQHGAGGFRNAEQLEN
jgi:hypothetical protein